MDAIAFTGHRPKDLGGYNSNPTATLVKETLLELIQLAYFAGYRKFITGMAMGVDQWAGDIVAELKKTHKDIVLIAAVPFATQSNVWFKEEDKRAWQNLLKQCDEIYLVDENPNTPCSFEHVMEMSKESQEDTWSAIKKLNDRNEWMVDRAECMIGIWKEKKGGTGNCIDYAKSKGKKIVVFNPDKNEIIKIKSVKK